MTARCGLAGFGKTGDLTSTLHSSLMPAPTGLGLFNRRRIRTVQGATSAGLSQPNLYPMSLSGQVKALATFAGTRRGRRHLSRVIPGFQSLGSKAGGHQFESCRVRHSWSKLGTAGPKKFGRLVTPSSRVSLLPLITISLRPITTSSTNRCSHWRRNDGSADRRRSRTVLEKTAIRSSETATVPPGAALRARGWTR